MALILGTNCGFITEAPVSDPDTPSTITIDGRSNAVKDTSPADADKITEIGFWIDNSTPDVNFEVGLYAHDGGTDKPAARLFVDNTNAKGSDVGWKTVTVDWNISPSTVYWIAVQIDNTTTTLGASGGLSGTPRWSFDTSQSSLTDPWGSSSESSSAFGLYALVEITAIEEGIKTITMAATVSLPTDLTVRVEGIKTVTVVATVSLLTDLTVRIEGTKTVTTAVTVSLASENYVGQSGFPTDRPSDYDGNEYWDEDTGVWGSTRTTIPGNWVQNVLAISEEGEIYFRTV